jgi:Matrixin
MIRQTTLCWSLCVLMLLTTFSVARAQDAASLALDLGTGAELVVAGRVTHLESRWDAGVIYEYVTVQVAAHLKGAPTPATVVIKQLGGRVGTLGLHIEGQASFAAGEDVLLFLVVRPRDQTLYTAGLDLGKWQVVPDLSTGRRRAIPPTPAGTGRAGPAADTLGLYLDQVTALVASTPLQQIPFVSVPPEAALATPAYTYLSTDGGPPARWHQADDSVPIPVDFLTPPGGGFPGGQVELASALGRWNAGGTRLRLQLAPSGDVNPPCNYGFVGDDRIRVYFDDPCGEISDDDPTVFGIGGGFYTTGSLRTINGTTFQKFVQGLVVLNNTGPHLASAGCVEDALTHKVGHAVGLGHSGSAGSIMQVALPSGCASGASSLGQDDLNGLRAIYPAVANGPNPPLPPGAFGGTATLNTVTLQWIPATSGGPADTYIIEAGSAPGLSNLAMLLVNAPATSLVVGNVPTGVYYVRIRARNIIATSGPSQEAVITVGPCLLPGLPQSFTAGTNDTFVSLSWTSPASGGPVQGYTLAVGSASGLSNVLVQALPASPTAFGGAAAYGDYYARLSARNTCGLGPATPELLIHLQPCSGPPNAPTALTFTRTGNQVGFAWTPPPNGPAPTRYVLVVGSTPGAANLLVQPTPNAMPSFSAVGPRGTYFVRLLAQNACGSSAFSNEVRVVIP